MLGCLDSTRMILGFYEQILRKNLTTNLETVSCFYEILGIPVGRRQQPLGPRLAEVLAHGVASPVAPLGLLLSCLGASSCSTFSLAVELAPSLGGP